MDDYIVLYGTVKKFVSFEGVPYRASRVFVAAGVGSR